ncbi:MAG: 3-dehydroquinate synthase [Crocinitomicaceae bacterium]|nr:3-dehydroquinate synthase [Crocinitomicaceae bacterium]
MQHLQGTNYFIEVGGLEDSSLTQLIETSYNRSKIVIMVDENTHDYCLEYLLTTFDFLKEAEVMLLPAGEENKVMEVCFQVWEALTEYGIGRNDLIINLGGGVVTDMGGFIASIYKRGVDFIHIPTSLLAMVDASIGGKTGVDLGVYKNQLGVFNQPKAIFIDPAFLQTLPVEEKRNGFAEMLKHGLVADEKHWNNIKGKTVESLTLQDIVESVTIKFNIVEEDPYEKNSRKKLNFGHTIGHAIEGYLLQKEPISHGYAVAMGMLVEAGISFDEQKISENEFNEIRTIIVRNFQLIAFESEEITIIVAIMQNDKKNSSNKINFSLLNGIGSCEINCEFESKELINKFDFLN